MAGWYVLKKSGDKFMFNLKAANGEVILTSQRYASRASAENGISSVQRNSPSDDRYERLESRAGQPYFTLKAENGRSEEHTSELQSRGHLVCRLLLEKKKQTTIARDPSPAQSS